jgi:glycosyltransferase involved in cell wall biosynthesis
MVKLLAIIPGDINKPSTRFRLIQYESLLLSLGVELQLMRRKELTYNGMERFSKVDVILNCKCLFDLGLARQLVKLGKRLIFDFDDAIYTRPGKPHFWLTRWRVQRRLRFWLEHAHVVTIPNQILAGYARRYAAAVTLVPMAVDLERWQPINNGPRQKVRLGWIGSPVNLINLEKLAPVLKKVLMAHPQTELAVFCGRKPRMDFSYEYHPFDPDNEAEFVQSLDIGLLPLTYDEFALGKSPIKVIQYLACGVPVVGNIQGGAAEILTPETSMAVNTDGEWLRALDMLISDDSLRRNMGDMGRIFAFEHHDRMKIVQQLVGILKTR